MAQPRLTAAARLFGDATEPGSKLAAVFEQASVADGSHRGRRGERPDADAIESLWAGRVSGVRRLTEKSREWREEGGGEGGIMEEA